MPTAQRLVLPARQVRPLPGRHPPRPRTLRRLPVRRQPVQQALRPPRPDRRPGDAGPRRGARCCPPAGTRPWTRRPAPPAAHRRRHARRQDAADAAASLQAGGAEVRVDERRRGRDGIPAAERAKPQPQPGRGEEGALLHSGIHIESTPRRAQGPATFRRCGTRGAPRLGYPAAGMDRFSLLWNWASTSTARWQGKPRRQTACVGSVRWRPPAAHFGAVLTRSWL